MPRKTILIFANCHNPTALGDFQTAGKLARDIVVELNRTGVTDIDVVLTTLRNRLGHYTTLYGATSLKGEVDVDGVKVKVSALHGVFMTKLRAYFIKQLEYDHLQI